MLTFERQTINTPQFFFGNSELYIFNNKDLQICHDTLFINCHETTKIECMHCINSKRFHDIACLAIIRIKKEQLRRT